MKITFVYEDDKSKSYMTFEKWNGVTFEITNFIIIESNFWAIRDKIPGASNDPVIQWRVITPLDNELDEKTEDITLTVPLNRKFKTINDADTDEDDEEPTNKPKRITSRYLRLSNFFCPKTTESRS